MPELPEVETIRRGLLPIRNKKITRVIARVTSIITPKSLPQKLKNQKIIDVRRRGKLLICSLSGGDYLLIHLKMTGQLVYQPRHGRLVVGGHPIDNVEKVPNKFTHIEIHFADDSTLYFNDVRRFGWMRLVDANQLAAIKLKYGPEPFDRLLTNDKWLALLQTKKNLSIKKALLDQKNIAGLGNIYVDEACYYTKIKPTRVISSLTKNEKIELLKNIRKVLKLSIKHGGTSFNTYRQVHGAKGNFINYLKVYGQTEVICRGEKHEVIKIRHAGRGTHFCQKCQK